MSVLGDFKGRSLDYLAKVDAEVLSELAHPNSFT